MTAARRSRIVVGPEWVWVVVDEHLHAVLGAGVGGLVAEPDVEHVVADLAFLVGGRGRGAERQQQA